MFIDKFIVKLLINLYCTVNNELYVSIIRKEPEITQRCHRSYDIIPESKPKLISRVHSFLFSELP